MTIAACLLTPEGVVLGADSTTTVTRPTPIGQAASTQHLNYAQKIFEVGGPKTGTMAVVTWENAMIGEKSHRTFIAEFSKDIASKSDASMFEAATIFSDKFWEQYNDAYASQISRAQEIAAKGEGLSEAERSELNRTLQGLSGGYCLAGRSGDSR